LDDIFDETAYPDLLVGLSVADDAAVWKLSDDRALVFTADFFTPIVDDPYDYGAIAAANALSDIYAMGGEPFLALNLAALPATMPEEIIADILRGSAEKVKRRGPSSLEGTRSTTTNPSSAWPCWALSIPSV